MRFNNYPVIEGKFVLAKALAVQIASDLRDEAGAIDEHK
jgi:hypothetical protein